MHAMNKDQSSSLLRISFTTASLQWQAQPAGGLLLKHLNGLYCNCTLWACCTE
jgi:hypothetical protein